MKKVLQRVVCMCLLMVTVAAQAQRSLGDETVAIAERLDQAIERSGKSQIAVLDFTDQDGRSTAIGQKLADDLRYQLLQQSPAYAILERRFLDRVIEEQRLSAQPLMDEERAIALGKLSSADAILFGTIRPEGRRATVTTKLINTETGVLIAMDRVEVRISAADSRASKQRNGVNYERRNATDQNDRGEAQPYIPLEVFGLAGTRVFHDNTLPSFGGQVVLRHLNAQKPSEVAGTAWVFGLYVAPGMLNDINNEAIGLGYRQPLNTSDRFGFVRRGIGGGAEAGDVWLLDRYEEDFVYTLPSNLESARIAHVKLSNIRINHAYADLWYKFYLTKNHTYSNVTKPYMGFGMGLGGLFYTADYTGVELFLQRDLSTSFPYEVIAETTPINTQRFPFTGFRNHLIYYEWTMYFGIERGRFGAQLMGGISSVLGGSPLILPYLAGNNVNDREVERKLQEDGLVIFGRVVEDEAAAAAVSEERRPFDARFSAALKLTYRFR
jgi:TolB-like protein